MDGSTDLSDTLARGAGAPDMRLQELNHRVLNSLTMLSSIIGMEARALNEGAGRAALDRVRSRLVAVSNLYRILGESGTDSFVDAGTYLWSVAEAVDGSLGAEEAITLDVRAVPCALTTSQAASVGLIVNEAMTNAYKHAFTEKRQGRITVALSETSGDLVLSVTDDGCGMGMRPRDGLGTILVESLAVDLGGEVTVTTGPAGTCVTVRFPRLP